MENEKTRVMLLKTPDGREVNLTEFLATHPAFVIGTDARAGLQLMGIGVEPAHAVITCRGEKYLVVPRVPAAKVWVNGERITLPVGLDAGDIIQVGSVALTVAQSEMTALSAMLAHPLASTAPLAISQHEQRIVGYNQAALMGAAAITAQPSPRQVYFPKKEVSSGVRLSALASGVITLLIVVIVIGYGFVSGSPASAADITSQYAYKDGHVTVVMFEASWCHFCKQQKPILTSLANEYRGKVYNQFLDAEAPINNAMVTAFDVNAYPVTVIFNDQGHVTAKFLGLTDAMTIRAAINQSLSESVGQTAPAA